MEHVLLPYLSQPACWKTLENGHQILVIPKAGEVVHLHTVVRTGSIHETDDNTGVSHFLEHLMFKGTPRFPAGAFDRMLEGIGARVNASTAKDLTQYFITVPLGSNGDYFHLALDLHADMLLNSLLPEEEIGPPFDAANPLVVDKKRERMVVIEEIKMGMDNPWRQAIKQLNELLYPTHPYHREVIGTAQVIASIPRQAIVDYYRTWYQPSNMITILAGDFEPEVTIDEVAAAFTYPTPQPTPLPQFLPETPQNAPCIMRNALPLNVSYVLLGFLGPPAQQLREAIALDVLSLILGEGNSSRLQQRLVEQLPNTPFIEAGAAHWGYRESSNVLGFGIARPDGAEEAFDLLRAEVDLLHAEPPSTEEIEKAVTRLEASFAAQAETASGICGGLADSMSRLNTPSFYTEYLPILRSLSRDELAACTAAYLPSAHLCAVIVAPEGKD